MKLLLCISPLLLAFASNASAVDLQPSTGLYYFTNSQEKIAAAQTELAEENLAFHSKKDPRVLARDFAREELARGNVCLAQAEQDLRAAMKSKLLSRMCREIFRDDISKAQAVAQGKQWKADSVHCEASLEAHEAPDKMKVVLAFRTRIVMQERLPAKLAKAGFGQERQSWLLPPQEAALGESTNGWKGILKSGACSLEKSILNDHLDRFKEKAKEVRVLARCRQRLHEQVGNLVRVQARLKQYVPAEWFAEAGVDSKSQLFESIPVSSYQMDMKACSHSRKLAAERMEELRDLSESIAGKHDIPALNPRNWTEGRKLASEEEERE